MAADVPEAEVIVVDNAGRDRPLVEREGFEHVRVVEPNRNVGFATGCNRGAAETDGDVLVFLNPDTVVEPGALESLARTLDDGQIGVAMARLRLLDRPELLNSGGSVLHISGLAWAGRYGEPAATVSELEDVAAASGAALAVRRETFERLGGFTDEFFMYHEDLELSWRAHLAGLRVVVDPEADVYHEYEFGRNVGKIELLERNRLIFVLTAFSPRLLLLLGPVLVAAELGLAVLAIKRGWFRGKLAGWWWCMAHASWLHHHRRETQALRRVNDGELASFLTSALDPRMVALPQGLGFANTLLRPYWALVRRAL